MEAFALPIFLPLAGLGLLGCFCFWRLINYGSTRRRLVGWLFFVPTALLTLFSLLMLYSIFNPSKTVRQPALQATRHPGTVLLHRFSIVNQRLG
jgi:hypothetical protein